MGHFDVNFASTPNFINSATNTTAWQTLYTTISLHIYGGGKVYLIRDMEKPGSIDPFPKRTGCTPWLFRIYADTKLNGAFNNSRLDSKKK